MEIAKLEVEVGSELAKWIGDPKPPSRSSLAQQNEYDLRQDWLLASARDDTESNKKIEVVAFTFKRLQETCVRQLRMAIIHFGVIMIDIWL